MKKYTSKEINRKENTTNAKAKLCGGNIKLGNMMTFSKLYGNDLFDTPYGLISGTCGKYCIGCKKECYVRKSYRYGSVINCHARNTVALRNDIVRAFDDMKKQVARKRNKPNFIRINQSGEIETKEEFLQWVDFAREYNGIQFYLYTKAFNIVCPCLDEISDNLPSNITVLFSVWHEYGISEFKRYQHLTQVKAFAVVDNDWTIGVYAKHGIFINAFCTAYTKDGKLNHSVTCDKCQKCFNRIERHKVIGCYAH